LVSKIIDKILCKILTLKNMNPLDEFFLFNSCETGSNVCITMKMEKLKHENIKKWIHDKFYSVPWT